jgi:hypothetical protein
MAKIGQKAAFAQSAQKEDSRKKSAPKSKGNKKGKKNLTPTSRKGKNKFRY